MSNRHLLPPLTNALVSLAALVIIIAGLREMATVLVPMLLSVFIAIICWPPLFWLYRRGIPYGIAILVIICGILGVIAMLTIVVGTSVDSFISNLPKYQIKLRQQEAAFFAWLTTHESLQFQYDSLLPYLDPGKIMGMVANALSRFGRVFTDTLLITLTVVFILLEALILPGKLHKAFGGGHAFDHFDHFVSSVKHYLAIKTVTSLATGGCIAVFLALIKIDYPILWGLAAFLLNFIPSIGSIIAAVPAILLALIQYNPAMAGYTALGYVSFNLAIGNFIEPRVMGKGLGLSPLVVFLSLIFWGWLFGPIGMLLSVPFTMILKIALENTDDLRWLAILLGPGDENFHGTEESAASREA